jgi:hypothetical protein
MIAVSDLTDALGGGLLTVVGDPHGAEVDDVTIAEPGHRVTSRAGDLVLGVGVQDVAQAVELLHRCAQTGAGGMVLRRGLAQRRRVREAATSTGTALVALAEQASWAHLVWLLRGVVDRTSGPDARTLDLPAHDDLFVLADAAATLVGGPVTIEDARHRVLAYSARQDVTDATRVSTIIGRRVPEPVLASYRSRGVFRRLATSDEPFFLSPSADGVTMARFVVPVRAGAEWLGSIWVVIDRAPVPIVVEELVRTASVVALHLLRLRSRTDLSQRVLRERLRTALEGTSSDAHRWLPPAPWRVVALGPGTGLELWESLLRRRSWTQPQVVDLDGRDYAVVGEEGGADVPGTWPWLRALVEDLARDGEPVLAGAGRCAEHPVELARSRADALETLLTLEHRAADPTGPVAATVEQAWAAVTTERAVHGLGGEAVLGPLTALQEHDEQAGTDYLVTLAAWLEHPGEPGVAARRIPVHPNTLRYRMQRITALGAFDLHDPDTRLALQLQLRALGLPRR